MLYRNNRVKLTVYSGQARGTTYSKTPFGCHACHGMSLAGLGSSYWRLSSFLDSHSGRLRATRQKACDASRYPYRAPRAVMPDWARIRADTPAAEKVLHFNNAGARRAALSVSAYVTRQMCKNSCRLCVLQAVHCQHSKSRRLNMLTWSLKQPLVGKHTIQCSLVNSFI